MEERISVQMRFEALLMPAISAASDAHVKALQRLVGPIVHSALQQLYAQAEGDAERINRRQLVCFFQQRLSNSNDFENARKELLAQLLGSRDDPSGVQYVNAVQTAFFSRVHVLTAAHPHLSQSFNWRRAQSASKRPPAAPNYRVSANCTPLTFLHLIYSAAAKAVFKNPFLFIKDVNAQRFVERRRQCMQQIADIIDALLYDKCNEMVIRLWKEVANGSGIVTPPPTRVSTDDSHRNSFRSSGVRDSRSSRSMHQQSASRSHRTMRATKSRPSVVSRSESTFSALQERSLATATPASRAAAAAANTFKSESQRDDDANDGEKQPDSTTIAIPIPFVGKQSDSSAEESTVGASVTQQTAAAEEEASAVQHSEQSDQHSVVKKEKHIAGRGRGGGGGGGGDDGSKGHASEATVEQRDDTNIVPKIQMMDGSQPVTMFEPTTPAASKTKMD